MQLVIADTGPINYLILIVQVGILPRLFGRVVLPSSVWQELTDPNTPSTVRAWISHPPAWIEIRNATIPIRNSSTAGLGRGETEAIALAAELYADLILVDDRRGVLAAEQNGLSVTGTLGLLARAARRRLVDLPDAFNRLKETNFRYPQATMDALLAEDAGFDTA